MTTPRFLDIPALTRAQGSVRVPGSKSITNRALLLAALCDGPCRITGALASEDTQAMVDALRTLGVAVAQGAAHWHVEGVGAHQAALKVSEADLHLGNAGTAMRPLAAVLAVLAARDGGRYRLQGTPRMHERPIGHLVDALRAIGCPITELGHAGFPPLQVGDGSAHALALSAPLRVRGDVSSQFASALLMALPLLADRQDVTLQIDGPLTSAPYVEITLALMAQFGVAVNQGAAGSYTVAAGSRYRVPERGEVAIEGDATSASYFLAAGALGAVDVPLRVEGVGRGAMQGDTAFADVLAQMGAQVSWPEGGMAVQRGAWPLKPLDIDCSAIPDAAMTLAVLALFANGRTRLRGIASWRVKETDRIAAMAAELARLGAHVEAGDDWLAITPPAAGGWRAAAIRTYDDHRMAMCFALAAFNPDGQPVRIVEPACVNKTFPDFFRCFFSVAIPAPGAVPVITIDGPTASGKGTLAAGVAATLGYHLLDSGALYRATALAAVDAGIALDDAPRLADLAARLDLSFDAQGRVWLGGRDISDPLRLESTGGMASQVSVHPAVRQALFGLQQSFRRLPGLVADGRDMGTVIFPHAPLKVFLTASRQARAERRCAQLAARGKPARIEDLLADIGARDERDSSRTAAPLKPAEDALLLDNSLLSAEQSVVQVLEWWQQRQPFGAA